MISAGAPHYYRLLTAAAFNDLHGAQKELSAMARAGATSAQLADGHYAIYHIHYRNGLYRGAIEEMRRIAALAPDRAPSGPEKMDAAAVARLPGLKVISRKSTRITATDWQGSGVVGIPAMVNGVETQFALDTGAVMSSVTELKPGVWDCGSCRDKPTLMDPVEPTPPGAMPSPAASRLAGWNFATWRS
jgi:hypothetical protein